MAKKRARFLLEALLNYANSEIEYPKHLEDRIEINTQISKQLIVRTQLRYLEELMVLEGYGKFGKSEIQVALKNLENFLGILQDNRTKTQGSSDWHFTLMLWNELQNKQSILKQFDLEWKRRRDQRGDVT